jgi:hypothetical protein
VKHLNHTSSRAAFGRVCPTAASAALDVSVLQPPVLPRRVCPTAACAAFGRFCPIAAFGRVCQQITAL